MKSIGNLFWNTCAPCLTALVVVICLASCGSDEQKANKAAATLELAAIEQDYCLATNIVSARMALSRHLALLENWRDEGKIRLDYDYTLAFVEARLYAVELESGNVDVADRYFLKWSNHMAQVNLRRGLPSVDFTTQQSLQMVQIADSNLVLRWKGSDNK